MPQQLNMICIHTIESKKEYCLYIPGFCTDNNKKINQIFKDAKTTLNQYSTNSKIYKIVITWELNETSFPTVYPRFKNEHTYKYKPSRIIHITT